MVADEHAISIDLTLASPPERVFRAWTEPADLEEWLADRAEVDDRVGGTFRLVTDGSEEMPGPHTVTGAYREFAPGRRLVMTWRYEGPDPEDVVETVVTVDLAREEGGTVMQFREAGGGLETEEDRAFSIDAWQGAFEALQALVEDGESLQFPVPRFW